MSKEKQIDGLTADIANMPNSVDCIVAEAEYLYSKGWRKQSEWISVDERLPEVGESVLGYAESMEECFVVAYSNTYRTFFCGQFPNDDITHWMPLPEAPKGGAE